MPDSQLQSYEQFLDRLDRLGQFRMHPSLDRISQALQRMPGFNGRIVHIVGTNAKGSIARFLETAARAHGVNTGLFTSPHFTSVRERILVDGRMLSEEMWLDLANQVFSLCGDIPLTYFELLLAMALLAFAKAGVDLAVLEAGLGGTWDATCAAPADLTVMAPIGLDHQHVLGETLAQIVADKANAIRPDGLALSAEQAPEALMILRRRALDVGAQLEGPRSFPMRRSEKELRGLRLRARGDFQRRNAACAWTAFKIIAADLGAQANLSVARRALAAVDIPGRMQMVRIKPEGPRLLLDGGHNVHALTALACALAAENIRPAAVVFACLADKDLASMTPVVRSLTDGPLVVPEIHGNERSRSAVETAKTLGPGARSAQDVEAALVSLQDVPTGPTRPILVCGSLFLLAELFTFHPEFLDQSGSEP
jgi:dihydrofolate synthase/folylpolyglutamate synthase